MTPTPPRPPQNEASPLPPPPPDPGRGLLTVGELLARVTPRAFVTPSIAVLLVVSFAFSVFRGVNAISPTGQQLLDAGGSFGPNVLAGEWWRLWTATMLHAGLLHLAFNLYALWNAGHFAERVFGNGAYAAIYVLSGLGGALLSVTAKPLVISVGASGAVFGVYGALLGFVVTHKGVFTPEFLAEQRNSLLAFLGYNLVFSLSVPNIDLWGHTGGFLTGFAAGVALSRDLLQPSAQLGRRAAGAAAIAVGLAVGGVGLHARLASHPRLQALIASDHAIAALKAGRYDEAVTAYTRALELQPRADWTWSFNRALAHLALRQAAPALTDARAAHAANPTPKTQLLLCEVADLALGEPAPPVTPEEAERLCADAVATNPTDPGAWERRASARLDLKRPGEALTDAEKALELEPGRGRAHLLRASALVRLKRPAEAIADCAAVKPEGFDEAWPRLVCADAAWAVGDAEQVLVLVDPLVAKRADPTLLGFRASALEHLGRIEQAVAALDAALEGAPDDPRHLNNRAWMKVVKGDFASAEADARRAVALTPDNPNAQGTHCFALAGLGRVADARAACARSLALRADGPIDEGMLRWLEGKPALAVSAWEKAAAANPVHARELAPWLEKARAGRRP